MKLRKNNYAPTKKRTAYVFLGFLMIAIICMTIAAWQMGIL